MVKLNGIFVEEKIETETIEHKGTDVKETRGNVATLAERGMLPCMWFMDSSCRIIVGADKKNPPIPFCDKCPVPGGPIVRANYNVPSRAYCDKFGNPQNYVTYPNGVKEWCWGPHINPDGWGEAVWEFQLKPKSMRQLKSIELEIGDNPSSNGRLHSNKSGDLAQVFVNGRLVAQYVLDLPTPYHEHIWRDGTHQPLDPQRQGSLLDITELSRQDNKVKIMVRVGPCTKWDISTVRLHIKTRKRELTKLAWTMIGFLLGLIPLVLVKSWP